MNRARNAGTDVWPSGGEQIDIAPAGSWAGEAARLAPHGAQEWGEIGGRGHTSVRCTWTNRLRVIGQQGGRRAHANA